MSRQTTLHAYEINEDSDYEYDHLVAHLEEVEPRKNDSTLWTRDFSREDVQSLKIATYQLGSDLSFDRAMRKALEDTTEPKGEILFSPMMIEASNLNTELSQSRIAFEELL